jgi:CHAT domain-containing protein/tetratricopeptide (TPR) repeat protein
MQKISILLLLFVVTFFRQAEEKKNYEITNSYFDHSLDSIRISVNKNGWNNLALHSYQSYILNSSIDINKEKKAIIKLPSSFERTFLFSMLYKRELKFKEMFDSLYSVLDHSPDYLYYYDELSFASIASNRQSAVKTYFDQNKLFKPEYRYYLLGLLNLSAGNSKDALVNLVESLKSDPLNPHIFYQISFAYRDLGDYPKALDALKKSFQFNDYDKNLIARDLLAQGSIYFLSGKTQDAEKYYTSAFELASSIKDLQTKSRSMVNLGILQDIKGNNIQARNYFYQAQVIASEINDLDNNALSFSELGVSYSFTNNLIEAKNSYLKSYEIYKTLGNRGRLSLLSDNIAKIYMTMFDYTSALKFYQEGIQFAGDNKRAHVLNLVGLADVYSNLSNYTKAIGYYKEARELSNEINELSLKAEVDKGLGVLNYNLDKYENALHYFYSFEELNKKSGYSYLEADANHKIGICLMQLDSLKDSGKYLLLASADAKISGDIYLEALCYSDLASLYIKQNYFSEVSEYLTKAKRTAAKGNYNYLNARIELIEGDISKNFDIAKSHYESCLALSNKINDPDLRIDAYSALAGLFGKNNLSEAADSYFNSAINQIENVSRPLFGSSEVQITYFSSRRDIYSSYAEFLLKQGKFEQAFTVIDKSRSRNLMQNLTNLKLRSLIKDEVTLNRIYEYDWMIHSGLYNQSQTDSITLQYNLLKKNLIIGNKDLSDYLENKTGISIPEIQKKLNNGENILSVFTSVNNTHLFLINKKEFKTFETDLSKSELNKLISSISPYYSREGNSSVAFYNQDLFSFNAAASHALYNKLLKEALKGIPKQEKVIIIPSSELTALPFDFLVSDFDSSSSSYSYKDKHFILYDFDFSYSTSASAFIEEKTINIANSNKSLIVGDPSIDTHLQGFAERRSLLEDNPGIQRSITLLPLKYSKEEVSEIGSIVNADKILTDKNATETNFKKNAESRSIIHLSTHSFLVNKQPVIFFSNIYDPDNDGFLEAGEIVQLKLNSDLVVLSSCNSGLGRIDESEGIIGMAKAFFEAGARSIIVSLWEVNDKYTSKLMTSFYRKLNDGMDKSEALRQAKIEFIKEYSPNPYYWGAFVLSGDVSTLSINHPFNFNYLILGLVLLISIITLLYFRKIKHIGKV